MRVLLVTLTDLLPFVLTNVLNPALDYCAIVVDEPDPAKKMLTNVPPLRDKIFPFYELKECIENYHYDFLIYTPTDYSNRGTFANAINKYKPDKNKVLELFQINVPENFLVERALRYYGQHAKEFEMVSIGMSYLQDAIVPKLFKKKLFNFGIASQDLYYDYKIAQFVFNQTAGGQTQVFFDRFSSI